MGNTYMFQPVWNYRVKFETFEIGGVQKRGFFSVLRQEFALNFSRGELALNFGFFGVYDKKSALEIATLSAREWGQNRGIYTPYITPINKVVLITLQKL
jgi:hypothetical protein